MRDLVKLPIIKFKIYFVRSEFPAFGVNGFKIKADYVTIKSFINKLGNYGSPVLSLTVFCMVCLF
jgi:hypothetical protein